MARRQPGPPSPGHYPRPKHAPGYEPRGAPGAYRPPPKAKGLQPVAMEKMTAAKPMNQQKARGYVPSATRGRGTNRADEIFVNSVKLDPSQVTDRRHHGPPPANKRQR